MSESEDISYDSDASSIWTSYGETSDDDDGLLQSQLDLIQEQITQSDSDRELYFNESTNAHNATVLTFNENEDKSETPSESDNYPIKSGVGEPHDPDTRIESFDESSEINSEMSGSIGNRRRLKSQDSVTSSNPKSWTDFEEETRSWRPIRYNNTKKKTESTIFSDTRVSFESSEGYKSDSLKSSSSTEKLSEKPKNSLKKERNIQTTGETIDSAPAISRANSLQSLSDSSSSDHFLPLHIKDIIQIRLEPEETFRNSKSMLLTTAGVKPDHPPQSRAARTVEKLKVKTETKVSKLPSSRIQLTKTPLLKRTLFSDKRDVSSRRFEQNQKSVIGDIENIYERHGQRTSQLLMDLHIQMTKSGFGNYRPKIDY